jgi:glycosyltransferase involved in cell wall biosynthesis
VRIAIVSDWFAPRRGGIETQLVELAERLTISGHDVDVITSTPGARDGAGYRVRRLEAAITPRSALALSPLLIPALRRELGRGYDVVHAHVSVVSPVGYVGAAVGRALQAPVVVTFHSVLRTKAYLLRATHALTGIGRSAVLWSGVSELVAGQLRRAFGGAEVAVLPNGVDLAFWNQAPRAKKNSGPVTLISTMRLHAKKRPRQLVRAFAEAAERAARPARLAIVGDGPERETVEREARRHGLASGEVRVEVLGWLGRNQLRARYGDSDGFVLASKRESFGIAALEARAAGLPVIAMSESGSAEFLRNDVDAMLCSTDGELIESMARFMSDGGLRTRLGGPSSLGRYDWDTVVALHEATYLRAMKRAAVGVEAVVASA